MQQCWDCVSWGCFHFRYPANASAVPVKAAVRSEFCDLLKSSDHAQLNIRLTLMTVVGRYQDQASFWLKLAPIIWYYHCFKYLVHMLIVKITRYVMSQTTMSVNETIPDYLVCARWCGKYLSASVTWMTLKNFISTRFIKVGERKSPAS